jgi:hypothetical protein
MEKSVVDAFTEECVDGWGDYSLSSFDELKPSARLLRKILHRIVPVGRQKEQATRFLRSLGRNEVIICIIEIGIIVRLHK